VTGNIKFDGELAPQIIEQGRALREELFGDRPVWIAASTHEGEEELILDVHQALLADHPDLLLLLVPRHPERFADVRDLIRKSGLPFVARTDGRPVDEKSAVFLGDTMGEVPLFYAASDIAFVAGSLLPIGGHNLLEPAAQGVPVITGPHNFNAQDIADMFIRLGACRRVADTDELIVAVRELLGDPAAAREMGRKGQALLEDNRGALQRLMVLLEPLLADR
jgi:3-deoxy-D-manno-octulosonic-acid transferase